MTWTRIRINGDGTQNMTDGGDEQSASRVRMNGWTIVIDLPHLIVGCATATYLPKGQLEWIYYIHESLIERKVS